MAMQGIPLIEMLRELNKELKRSTVQTLIIPIVINLTRLYIEKHWGKDPRRVAVLGPYINEGERTLHIVAQKCAQRGHIAIMGVGFYHPTDPTTFHELPELLPSIVNKLLPLPEFKYLFYRHILPALVDKATMNLSHPLRTALLELEGLHDQDVPLLGYVADKRVSPTSKDCPYLDKNTTNEDFGCKCTADNPDECPLRTPNPPKCPFYNIVKIPLIVKQFFIMKPRWVLVAMNNLDKIDFYFDSFL